MAVVKARPDEAIRKVARMLGRAMDQGCDYWMMDEEHPRPGVTVLTLEIVDKR